MAIVTIPMSSETRLPKIAGPKGLSPVLPTYLPAKGLDRETVKYALGPVSYEAMAEQHLQTIRSIQPHGPYMLGGECNGGLVAYETWRYAEARDRIRHS